MGVNKFLEVFRAGTSVVILPNPLMPPSFNRRWAGKVGKVVGRRGRAWRVLVGKTELMIKSNYLKKLS
jgi:ribosomal protein L21E